MMQRFFPPCPSRKPENNSSIISIFLFFLHDKFLKWLRGTEYSPLPVPIAERVRDIPLNLKKKGLSLHKVVDSDVSL